MDVDSSIGKQISAEEAFEIIAECNYKRDAELREMVFKAENKRILKKDKKKTLICYTNSASEDGMERKPCHSIL